MDSHASMRRARTSTTKPGAGKHASAATLESYQQRLSALAERIRGTDNLGAIIDMLTQALTETQRLSTREAELVAARREVADAQRSIEAMRSELEQVRAMLHLDPLTGALNRRGLDEAYRQEASRCDRHGCRLSAVLIDLDNFKALNDTRGHPVGDRALVHFAHLVRGMLRPTDRVGRLGGEEFLVLLPDTGSNDAATVMARVRAELAASPLIEDAHFIAITFSSGIAGRLPAEPFDALLRRADAALYAAKAAGKNRCMLAA